MEGSVLCDSAEGIDKIRFERNINILASGTRINDGVVAGQSIMHLHIHLIPRYKSDVENPRGGVRGVIPNKQNYGDNI